MKIKTVRPNWIFIYAGHWKISAKWGPMEYWSGRDINDWLDRRENINTCAPDIELSVCRVFDLDEGTPIELSGGDRVEGYIPVEVVFKLASFLEESNTTSEEALKECLRLKLSQWTNLK